MAQIRKGAKIEVDAPPTKIGPNSHVELDESAAPQAPPEADFLKEHLGPGSVANSAGEGFLQGATFKFGDELQAANDTANAATSRARQAVGLEKPDVLEGTNAINENPATITKSWGAPSKQGGIAPSPAEAGQQPDLGDVYRKARDKYRGESKAAEEAHPAVYGGSELLGNVAVPIPGLGSAETVAGVARAAPKVLPTIAKYGAYGLGAGLALGAGGSESDLTQGENVGAAIKDVGKSGAYGLAGGLVGGVIAAGASKLATHFGGNADIAKAAKEATDLEDVVGSAKGTYGQKVQDSYRTLENLKNAAADPNVSAEKKAEIVAWLGGADGKALAQQVASSSLENAPGKIGDMMARKSELAAAPGEAAAKSADYFGQNTVTKDVLPRVARYAQRAIPAAAGGVMAGPLGAVAGGVAGAATGHPGTAMANLMQKTPRFTVQLNEALANRSNGIGETAGKLGGIEGAENADAIHDKVFAPVHEQANPGNIELGDSLPDKQNKLRQYFSAGQR